MFSVMQSPWTLREAETKKGRCSVFRQRPFDVSATTGCCRGCRKCCQNPRRGVVISEVRGKIENRRAQPDYLQQNRRSRKGKTGVRSADLDFTPHFRNRRAKVCGKFWILRAQRPFRIKKPQVDVLVVFRVVSMSVFCRMLPFCEQVCLDCLSAGAAESELSLVICIYIDTLNL